LLTILELVNYYYLIISSFKVKFLYFTKQFMEKLYFFFLQFFLKKILIIETTFKIHYNYFNG